MRQRTSRRSTSGECPATADQGNDANLMSMGENELQQQNCGWRGLFLRAAFVISSVLGVCRRNWADRWCSPRRAPLAPRSKSWLCPSQWAPRHCRIAWAECRRSAHPSQSSPRSISIAETGSQIEWRESTKGRFSHPTEHASLQCSLVNLDSLRAWKWAQWIVWTEGMSTLLLRIPLSDHRLVAHVPSTHIFADHLHDFEEQERWTVLDQRWFPLQSIVQRVTLFAQSLHNSPVLVWTIKVTHRRVKGEVLISLEETSIPAHWMSVDQEFIDVIWCWWMTDRRITLCRSSSHLERRTLGICWWRSVLVVSKCTRRVNINDFSAREQTRDAALVFLSLNVFPLPVIHQSRQHRRKARPAKHFFIGTVLTDMENERFSSLIRFILVFLLDRIFERVGWSLKQRNKEETISLVSLASPCSSSGQERQSRCGQGFIHRLVSSRRLSFLQFHPPIESIGRSLGNVLLHVHYLVAIRWRTHLTAGVHLSLAASVFPSRPAMHRVHFRCSNASFLFRWSFPTMFFFSIIVVVVRATDTHTHTHLCFARIGRKENWNATCKLPESNVHHLKIGRLEKRLGRRLWSHVHRSTPLRQCWARLVLRRRSTTANQ